MLFWVLLSTSGCIKLVSGFGAEPCKTLRSKLSSLSSQFGGNEILFRPLIILFVIVLKFSHLIFIVSFFAVKTEIV